MPWLTGTAFLHSAMIQEKRGMLKVWNVSLVLATGVLAILGTFLVRSGILESIHAFGDSTVGGPLLGLIAVVVITRAPEPPSTQTGARRVDPLAVRAAARSRRAVICAFGAGVGFGLFFVLLDHAPLDTGLWPLLGTRISLVSVLGLLVVVRRLSVRIPADMRPSLIGLGVVNTLADLLFLLATQRGLLSLVAVVTSMYPAATVALAALVLRERIASRQAVGLVIAAASVALIALG
jgi:cytochrome c biogenesis factor